MEIDEDEEAHPAAVAEQDESEEAPRKRRKKPRDDVEGDAVKGPAICLMIVGGIGLVLGLLNIAVLATGRGLLLAPRNLNSPPSSNKGPVQLQWSQSRPGIEREDKSVSGSVPRYPCFGESSCRTAHFRCTDSATAPRQ